MLKSIVKGSFLAGVGVTAASLLEYVYYVSMANMMGPDSFGLLSAALSVMWILVTLLTYSIGLSLAKFISEDENIEGIRTLVFNGLSLSFAATCATSVLLFFLSILVLSKTAISDLTMPLSLASFVMPFLAVSMILVTVFQGLNRMKNYSTMLVSNSLVKVAVAAYLVYAGYGMHGAIGAYAVGAVFSAAYGLHLLRDYVKLRQRLNTKLIKKIAFFSRRHLPEGLWNTEPVDWILHGRSAHRTVRLLRKRLDSDSSPTHPITRKQPHVE